MKPEPLKNIFRNSHFNFSMNKFFHQAKFQINFVLPDDETISKNSFDVLFHVPEKHFTSGT